MTKYNGQPFLRWAGSKRQLIPVLSRYWDYKYSRYVEPFAGSASFFFTLSPARALLGDINIEEADLLRDGFHTEVVVVRRNIAGFTERRKPARELLISNQRPRN